MKITATFLYFSLSLFPFFLFSNTDSSSDFYIKRIHAHFLLKDYRAALYEVDHGLEQYPQEKNLLLEKIKAFSFLGDEKEMITCWKQSLALYPELIENHSILEDMAWGIIHQGYSSSSPITRVIALIAAFYGNDSKGVHLIHKGLNDSNFALRAIAVQLAAEMRDDLLKQEILQILKFEKVWNVRQEAIKAVGKMQIKESAHLLKKIIAERNTSAEEKLAAITSFVNLLETADREEVVTLAHSPRAGLRVLACEVVAQLDLTRDLDLLIPLVKDHSSDVRKAALKAIGSIHPPKEKELISQLAKEMLDDSDIQVAITASWLLTLCIPIEGQKAFEKFLGSNENDVRLLATAALVATGSYGLPLTLNSFHSTSDPYVRLNLAMGLINQRVECTFACDEIYKRLALDKKLWMWDNEALFRSVSPSDLKHREDIPQYPELMNQFVRLEMIQILAFLRYPNAVSAMKQFLQERIFGVSAIAAALLLTEGDEEAMDLARTLLDDNDLRVRVQAALILSIWGRDEKVIALLQDFYFQSDREIQEKILEGIGHIGAKSSIPFLVDRLTEPYQHLRMIAASALLQSLNH